jgi:hypothetical protein
MDAAQIFRRTARRFEIPGAVLTYDLDNTSAPEAASEKTTCPLIDISRGGLRFISRQKLEITSPIQVKVTIPGGHVPLIFKGRVRWSSPQNGDQLLYQTGVEFNSYGEDQDQNFPGTLVKVVALEQRYRSTDDLDGYKEGGGFGI